MKLKKNLILLFILFLYFFSISKIVFATADSLKMSGVSSGTNIGKLDSIIGLFQLVGGGAAVASVSIAGIKYMLSSPDGRADVKKEMIPYIIGGFLLFGASKVAGIIEQIGLGFNGS